MFESSVRRVLSSLVALIGIACDAGERDPEAINESSLAEQRTPAQNGDGGTRSTRDAARRPRAGSGACSIPPGCDRVPLMVLSLEPCCTESIACGFEVVGGTPELRDTVAATLALPPGETCAARERYFIKHPTTEDMRLDPESGPDILMTSKCDTASILSVSFGGCCMPNNRCGVSTDGMWDTLAVIAPGEPFSKLECVASKELNAQLEDSRLRGLRFLPDTDQACDHAALDARLPPDPFAGW